MTINTSERLLQGAAAAGIVSIPLSLVITVFDRSITKYAKGTTPSLFKELGGGLSTLLKQPVKCFCGIDNRAVFRTYSATYLAKNSAETLAKKHHMDPQLPVFLASTLVNSPLSIRKDWIIAQNESRGVSRSFSLKTYSSLIARDSLIIGISFLAPPIISPHLQKRLGWSKTSADIIAQIGCSALAQIPATPLHMLGLDFYNRPDARPSERLKLVLNRSRSAILARMVRQSIAFGLGSLGNKALFN